VNSRRIVMGSPLFIFVGRSRYAADKRMRPIRINDGRIA
jgi:hypothetical protein